MNYRSIINFVRRNIFRLRRGEDRKFSDLLAQDIYIHPDSYIGNNTSIGYGTNINGLAYIASGKRCPVSIGKYCAIAHNFRIRPRNHNTNYINLQDKFQEKHGFPSLESIKGPVTIGNNVWIADNVIVLSGVSIGDGAVIGAGSIVTKDIPPYSLAVGSPAKVIKKRFSEQVISQLLQINWWDWSNTKIEKNRSLFELNLSEFSEIDLLAMIVD